MAWDKLRLFESRDVVQRECKRVTGREPNAAHCREIASSFMQGRQYLQAAADAGELVRPLLIYYAALCMTRALVMFRLFRRETALAQQHGLSASDWSKSLSAGLSAIPDLQIVTSNGTFSELAEATENLETVPVFSSMYPRTVPVDCPGTRTITPGATLTLGGVWRRMPELLPTYMATYGLNVECWPTFAFWLPGHNIDIELMEVEGQLPTAGSARGMLGLDETQTPWRTEDAANGRNLGPLATQQRLAYSIEIGTRARSLREECRTIDDLKRVARCFRVDAARRLYVVPPISPGLELSRLSLLLAAAYAGGMLVRYYPTRWQDLMRHEAGDRALALLHGAVDLVELQFPSYLLDALLRPL
jgi:hypothetical protein